MTDHRRLRVWHRANALSAAVHIAAGRAVWRGAPGLKHQLLGAVASIPANVSEGAGRGTKAEFAHFVGISIGSANEVETHMMLARALCLVPAQHASVLLQELDEIRRMLFGLRKHLQDGDGD